MLDTFKIAPWKSKLLNLLIWVFWLSVLVGCFIAFLGVLVVSTHASDGGRWEFYWNGIQTPQGWFSYAREASKSPHHHMDLICSHSGVGLVALDVAALLCVVVGVVSSSIRIVGVHLARFQPAPRWMRVEYTAAVCALLLHGFASIMWGASCLDTIHTRSFLSHTNPTGYIWLLLCIIWLVFAALAYRFIMLKDTDTYALGSYYRRELRDANTFRTSMTSENYLAEQPDARASTSHNGSNDASTGSMDHGKYADPAGYGTSQAEEA